MDAQPGTQAQAIPFRFTGTAGQYFGIWIVNILLTILTLGIYAPWAKVRTKRYFYGNTHLAGATFDYLANPITILKGWAIAVGVLIVYQIAVGIMPMLELVFVILFMLALPWIVVRAMIFRARNSAYRNIRFTFEKAYREAIRVFIVNALLIPLTLGLAMPYYIYAMNRFMVNNSGYGTSGFRFHGGAKDFYKIYMMAGLMLIGFVAIVAAAIVPMTKQMIGEMQSAADYEPAYEQTYESGDYPVAPFGPEIELHSDSLPAEIDLTQDQQTDADAETFDSTVENTDSLYSEDDYAYAEEEEDYDYSAEEDAIDPAMMRVMMMIQFGTMAVFSLFYLLAFAYIQARIGNLVFNKMELDGNRFFSVLRARDLMWLYASNAIAIILSFGLLIPWARIRMARYRADRLALLAKDDLDGFAQAQHGKISATGEELGEVFDIDIGL